MRKLKPCILLFIFICSVVSAQKKQIDSLYTVLKTASEDTNKVITLNLLFKRLHRTGDNHRADSIVHVAFALAEKLDYKEGMVVAYSNIGNLNNYQSNYSEALKNYRRSLTLAEEIGDTHGTENGYGNIGNIYFDHGNYPEALKNYLKSLQMAEKLGDKAGMGNAYLNIGNIYANLNNFTDALTNFKHSLSIDEEIGNKYDMCIDYSNIGVVYFNMGNYTEAMNSQLKSLQIAKEIDNKYGAGNAYSNLGNINCRLGNYTEATNYVQQALDIETAADNKQGMCNEYINMGEINTREKKYADAQAWLDKALKLSKAIGEKETIGDTYHYMNVLDSAMGNYKAAFNDYKMQITYTDSLKNEENTKKMVSEQMTYEFDKKQAEEKAIQDKKDAEEVVNKKRQQVIMASVSVGLLLVLVFSALLLSRFRITQKQKKIIEEQKALVEEKNKEVLDSIIYAKRLQDAILPPLSIISKYLPESFVLYKPKDIVAGDFYWMERAGDTILIAACDCTGHGVPGAMVSVVCSNALNRAVKEFRITETGKILDKVRELVLETFEQSESEVKDGMDISLVAISYQPLAISWSGAYNSLWYIRNGELREVAADKQPIGKNDKPTSFNTHNLNLQKGDTLYLFTDGYADQFGGDKGKKFKYKPFQEKLLAISNKPMAEQKQELETTFENWKGDLEQVDDVLIIGIRV